MVRRPREAGRPVASRPRPALPSRVLGALHLACGGQHGGRHAAHGAHERGGALPQLLTASQVHADSLRREMACALSGGEAGLAGLSQFVSSALLRCELPRQRWAGMAALVVAPPGAPLGAWQPASLPQEVALASLAAGGGGSNPLLLRFAGAAARRRPGPHSIDPPCRSAPCHIGVAGQPGRGARAGLRVQRRIRRHLVPGGHDWATGRTVALPLPPALPSPAAGRRAAAAAGAREQRRLRVQPRRRNSAD